MSQHDRHKWNERYLQQPEAIAPPAEILTAFAELLPSEGRALDVAGGTGRNALWLARRGFEVTLADIAPAGLQIAERQAISTGVCLQCVEIDLEEEPFPAGPWHLVVQVCYLQRDLFPALIRELTPGGIFIASQPTQRNLERWTVPPEKYLLAAGELLELARGLEILTFSEAWRDNGRHEAWLIGQRLPAS